MERVIKFRCWHKTICEMIYPNEDGEFSGNINGEQECSDFTYHNLLLPYETNLIPMQFTGLLDKNGKEIYEGDIVRIPEFYETPESTEPSYRNWEVFFVHGAFNIRRNPSHEIDINEDTLAATMHHYDDNIEVIGNIHENPELITNP